VCVCVCVCVDLCVCVGLCVCDVREWCVNGGEGCVCVSVSV